MTDNKQGSAPSCTQATVSEHWTVKENVNLDNQTGEVKNNKIEPNEEN